MPVPTKIQEPILVKNPNTGRFINVAPLFDAIAEFNDSDRESANRLKSAISGAIRFINLSCEGNNAQQKDVNYDLYRLEDMFDAMDEFK